MRLDRIEVLACPPRSISMRQSIETEKGRLALADEEGSRCSR